MEKKMTQKEFYTAIAGLDIAPELVEYAEAAITKIEAANEKAKAKRAEKVKEVKEEDVALMAAITGVLGGAEAPMTAKAIWEALGNADVKVQKVSAVLRKMDNVVAEDGKVKTYHLA